MPLYEGGEKTGKLFDRQLKQQKFHNLITALMKGDTIESSTREINKVRQQFYTEPYTSNTTPEQEEMTALFFSTLICLNCHQNRLDC